MRIEGAESVLEGFERDELCQLPTEDLGMTSEMVSKDLRSLLFLCEISALVETARPGRVHKKVRRSAQLNDETTRSRRGAVGTRGSLSCFQLYGLDVGEGEFDLVSSRIVVDVISNASLIGRIEDDEIHCILPDATPGTNAQRATSEVMNDYDPIRSRSQIHVCYTTHQLCPSHLGRRSRAFHHCRTEPLVHLVFP